MGTFVFSFHSIDNNDLHALFSDAASCAFYEHMYFYPFETFDEHNAGEFPDNAIIAYNHLSCNNSIVGEENTFVSKKNYIAIVHSNRSIFRNLEEFITDFNIATDNIQGPP